jgi:hypothetical protein
VLELGSGIGLISMSLASMGAKVCEHSNSHAFLLQIANCSQCVVFNISSYTSISSFR